MNNEEPQSITLHGVFMDVFGLGILLSGRSSIGKSEIALSLISRGHRLIADDAVNFQTSEKKGLMGSCPELLRDFLEVRGLGVLNIRAMYGDNAIKNAMPLQLIVNLLDVSEQIIQESNRLLGIRRERKVLDCNIPEVTIPVGPGRNISILIEAAVRNQRIKLAGYDAAMDFIHKQKALLEQGDSELDKT